MSDKTTAYQAKEINTSHEPITWSGLDTLASDLKNGHLLLWQYHGVFVGSITNGKISWQKTPETNAKHIERIRAFNESKEYHFWRNVSGLMGRLRTDIDGSKGEKLYVDTNMLLRGVIVRQLPISKEGEKWYITTRNYIEYNEIGQAGFVDSRFVEYKNL
ncbi:MAG: hypothetical protein IPM48_03920 [Saprospiraceae bacterium]|nr:hypothetical protein [Saprospiraceae bacterium]